MIMRRKSRLKTVAIAKEKRYERINILREF